MRCLVTGASGHLGAYLTRELAAGGVEVLALTRRKSDLSRLAPVRDQIMLVQGDLTDLSGLAETLAAAPVEITFHLAWWGITGADRKDVRQVTTNVMGSLNLFQIVQQAGCKCWVGCGSQEEYGPVAGVLTEDVPPRPSSAYGAANSAFLC